MVKNSQLDVLRQFKGGVALANALGCKDETKGLDASFDYDQRRKDFGTNELDPPPAPSYFALIWDGLHDTTILMLIAAAVVSLVLALIFRANDAASWIEGVAILGTVMVVLNVQAWTDYRTAATFRRQQLDLENGKAVHVIRAGQLCTIHPRELVVGDILRVSVGDILAADGVLIGDQSVKVDESSMTGESKLVEKRADSAGGSTPFLFSGTSIMEGQGRMLVLAIGINSIQGHILTFIQSADASDSKSSVPRPMSMQLKTSKEVIEVKRSRSVPDRANLEMEPQQQQQQQITSTSSQTASPDKIQVFLSDENDQVCFLVYIGEHIWLVRHISNLPFFSCQMQAYFAGDRTKEIKRVQ